MIYWCGDCQVPVYDNEVCPVCGDTGKYIASTDICNPVFLQERKLLSEILKIDLTTSIVWYLGNSGYLVNGVRTKAPTVGFFKNQGHLSCSDMLRSKICINDHIPNEDKFIAANRKYIESKIDKAERYIINLIQECQTDEDHDYIPTVSFSGGKDSTVVSRLVRDALQTEKIIHYFGDTTLEFPCTYEYVYSIFRSENPVPAILPSETENDFFKLCNIFGPPSRFERWCCTIFKTSSINAELQDLDGNSLTFLGIRRSESNERKDYAQTQRESKIGSQINAMPIIDWTDYDVWLYILYKKLAFNPAYKYGYKRVGCWCCPNNSDWSTMLTEIYFPELAIKWKNTLYSFAEKTGKTDINDYVENGKWKARKGASGLTIRNVNITDTPCNLSDRARNIIIKRAVSPDIIEFFKPFGELDIFDKDDATYITITEKDSDHPGKKVGDIIITYGTTVIKVLPAKGIDPLLLVNRIKCQMRKYQFCIRCTACDSICPYGAIDTMRGERYTIDTSKCKQNLGECSKCIAKFYNGCITCQVLAGKKNIPNYTKEM